jgi:hypothetical protein
MFMGGESLLEERVRKLESDLAALREEMLNDRARQFSKELVSNEQIQIMSQWLSDVIRAAQEGGQIPPPPPPVNVENLQ